MCLNGAAVNVRLRRVIANSDGFNLLNYPNSVELYGSESPQNGSIFGRLIGGFSFGYGCSCTLGHCIWQAPNARQNERLTNSALSVASAALTIIRIIRGGVSCRRALLKIYIAK